MSLLIDIISIKLNTNQMEKTSILIRTYKCVTGLILKNKSRSLFFQMKKN